MSLEHLTWNPWKLRAMVRELRRLLERTQPYYCHEVCPAGPIHEATCAEVLDALTPEAGTQIDGLEGLDD